MKYVFVGITIIILASVIQTVFAVKQINNNFFKENFFEHEDLFSPLKSKLRTYKNGAVCSDGKPCAMIGK